jgi:putative Ca2+/H+ antiporter (TMEM165/GDT1 family)
VTSSLKPENSSEPHATIKSDHLQIVATTFLTVFLAEIGDKTQLTTLMITAESKSPLIVFIGAAIALVTTSFLGVAAGKWLAKNVSPNTLNTMAGMSFLLLAVSLVWDA